MSGSASKRPLLGPGARSGLAFGALSVALTLGLGAAVLRALGVSPPEAYRLIVQGALGSPERLAYVFTAWAPLLLCVAGLLLTFAAGLWNIGIEGQVVLGAVAATGALRLLQEGAPTWLALLAAALAAMAVGGLWGLSTGALRVYGKVNEIFGGLGLNFIAGSLTVYLVLGPWARAGTASTSGTAPFPAALWLPKLGLGRLAVPIEVMLALAAVLAVHFALRGTYFGLQLKAVGQGFPAARRLGVPTTRRMLTAFALGGALAGLAGFALVAGAYSRHQLFPLVSGGYGFLAILVVLLSGYRPLVCIPVAFFFAALAMGSLQLPLRLQVDSAMAGVLEGLLVFIILLMQGLRARQARRRAA
jgi:simple sugar transport system permease protein